MTLLQAFLKGIISRKLMRNWRGNLCAVEEASDGRRTALWTMVRCLLISIPSSVAAVFLCNYLLGPGESQTQRWIYFPISVCMIIDIVYVTTRPALLNLLKIRRETGTFWPEKTFIEDCQKLDSVLGICAGEMEWDVVCNRAKTVLDILFYQTVEIQESDPFYSFAPPEELIEKRRNLNDVIETMNRFNIDVDTVSLFRKAHDLYMRKRQQENVRGSSAG